MAYNLLDITDLLYCSAEPHHIMDSLRNHVNLSQLILNINICVTLVENTTSTSRITYLYGHNKAHIITILYGNKSNITLFSGGSQFELNRKAILAGAILLSNQHNIFSPYTQMALKTYWTLSFIQLLL